MLTLKCLVCSLCLLFLGCPSPRQSGPSSSVSGSEASVQSARTDCTALKAQRDEACQESLDKAKQGEPNAFASTKCSLYSRRYDDCVRANQTAP